MNILIVVPWYKPLIGGVVVAAEKIASGSICRGHRAIILTHGREQNITPAGEDGGIKIFKFNMRPPFAAENSVKSLIAFLFYLIPTLVRLRRLLAREKIDVVLFAYPMSNHVYFRILKALFGTRYVISFRGSDGANLPLLPGPARRAVASLVKNADALIAVSESLMETVRKHLRNVPDHRRVIYNGIDQKWSELEPKKKYNLPSKYIFSLSWGKRVKGPDIVIEAFASLVDEYPDVSLVMAGAGALEVKLMEQIKRLGLENRVVVLGPVEPSDLPFIYRGALFGAMPSRNEGFGQVAIEFGILGKAVIASRVGSLPEIIEDGYNGILVPTENAKVLADKIRFLIENPHACREMGENAHQRVLEKFHIDGMVEGYLEILNEVLLR